MSARSRLGRLAAPLVLLCAGVAGALALGELFVRLTWAWSMPATERPPAPSPPRDLPELDPDLPVYRTLFDLGQPNADGVFKGLPYRTNSHGFRGPEPAPEPAPGVFRIVVGGDSVTMGSGVLAEEAYPALLPELLTHPQGRPIEVLNLGLSGLNTTWVVKRIARKGMPLHPDLIVYGYTLNDIEGPAYVSTLEPERVRALRREYRRFADAPSYLLRAVWPRVLALSERLFPRPGTYDYDLHYNYTRNEAAWKAVTDGLGTLARMADAAGICAHVLIHTGTAQLNRLFPFLAEMEQVADAARARGLTVTQTFPYFEGRDPTQLRISFADTHPNAAGHAILARALADGLAELPPRCWEGARR